MRWDIFCKVIDNHGDIGVCWRLAAELGQRGEDVTLWVDDPSALAWMAPRGADRVQVNRWQPGAPGFSPREVVVEAFGCTLDDDILARLAAHTRSTGTQPAWINLEYLTAEAFAGRNHGLPSPVLAGPARGLVKQFFHPGFTPRTGGLLREAGLAAQQATFDADGWLEAYGIPADGRLRVSLFSYEPALLGPLIDQLAAGPPARLLVTAGRSQAAVRAALAARVGEDGRGPGALAVSWLPLMPQPDFDGLLWVCDLNFARGEDSLVRALWAGRPFVWQLYPQDDAAHHAKLEAFMDWLEAPASLRRFHAGWNGLAPALPPIALASWAECSAAARRRALAQDDLVTQLLRLARKTQ